MLSNHLVSTLSTYFRDTEMTIYYTTNFPLPFFVMSTDLAINGGAGVARYLIFFNPKTLRCEFGLVVSFNKTVSVIEAPNITSAQTAQLRSSFNGLTTNQSDSYTTPSWNEYHIMQHEFVSDLKQFYELNFIYLKETLGVLPSFGHVLFPHTEPADWESSAQEIPFFLVNHKRLYLFEQEQNFDNEGTYAMLHMSHSFNRYVEMISGPANVTFNLTFNQPTSPSAFLASAAA